MDCLGDQLVRAPARRAGDPGSNPGPGENFSLKLLIYIYIYIEQSSHSLYCNSISVIISFFLSLFFSLMTYHKVYEYAKFLSSSR